MKTTVWVRIAKRVLTAALMCGMLLLTACGGSEAKNTGASQKDAPKGEQSGGDKKTYVMRVATPTTNDPQTHEMDLFKKVVEEKTKGQIKVELYPASQLGSNDQMLQQLSSGSIQGMLEPTAFLGGFAEMMTIVDIPYLWTDVYKATEYLNGEGGKLFEPSLSQKGLTALRFYEYGPRIILLKNKAEKMADLKGKKIRVMGAPVLVDEINSWGGAGVAMGVPELYTALQQGTLDGLESAAMFFYSGKYFESTKYLLMEPKGAEVTIFMANTKWLNTLPPNLQQAIKDAAKEIEEDAKKFARAGNDKAIGEMKKAGITVIEASPEFHKQLVDASQPIYQKFEQRVPGSKEIIEKIRNHFK